MRALGLIWILGLDLDRERERGNLWSGFCLVRGTAWARHGARLHGQVGGTAGMILGGRGTSDRRDIVR